MLLDMPVNHSFLWQANVFSMTGLNTQTLSKVII